VYDYEQEVYQNRTLLVLRLIKKYW